MNESLTEMLKEFDWETLVNIRKEARLCNLYHPGTNNWGGWNEISDKIKQCIFKGRNDHQYKIKLSTSKKDVGQFAFLIECELTHPTASE